LNYKSVLTGIMNWISLSLSYAKLLISSLTSFLRLCFSHRPAFTTTWPRTVWPRAAVWICSYFQTSIWMWRH